MPAAFHGEVGDVLPAALALAVRRWRGTGGPVTVDLERHGREDAFGLDLSRTVGWFTAVHPVRLDPGDGDAVDAVRRVKEQLRTVPDKGIGYGLLRHLDPDAGARLAAAARNHRSGSTTWAGSAPSAAPECSAAPPPSAPEPTRSCRWPTSSR